MKQLHSYILILLTSWAVLGFVPQDLSWIIRFLITLPITLVVAIPFENAIERYFRKKVDDAFRKGFEKGVENAGDPRGITVETTLEA